MRTIAIILLGMVSATATARAQGSTFSGRVLADSSQMLLAGAEVVLDGPQNSQRTNERGEFVFGRVSAGKHLVGVRMPGYAPLIDTIDVADAGELRRDYRLKRIEATLPEVPVRTTPLDRKLVEFHERRRMGIGRFMDSTEFANARGTRTSDRLTKLPGVLIQRGFGSAAFVTNTRQRRGGEPGSRSMCRSNVWLDGVNVGTEYNVNELDPTIIAAVEWYAGQASIPAKYNVAPRIPANSRSGTPEPYCGVLVIWLR